MFLPKMKKTLLLLGFLVSLASCSEYQKVLKKDDAGDKYKMAEQLYEEAQAENSKPKYRKALRLLEQIVPQYRGKPQGEKLSYLFANTYYLLEDEYLAGYQFERFVAGYPNSEKLEEAYFKLAKSNYYLSPRYDLDQSKTRKAMDDLQNYIERYPQGEYVEEANKLASDLQIKLEKKAFEIAKQYHHTENYKAAIVAFTNFLEEYPGSPFTEDAYYYKFNSAYLLAINSYDYLMKERLNTAKGFYNNYKKYYPDSQPAYYNQLQSDFEDLNTRLENY